MGRRRIDHETEMVVSQLGGRFVLESRASRVARLRQMVQSGSYRVDPEALAEHMLSRLGGDADNRNPD